MSVSCYVGLGLIPCFKHRVFWEFSESRIIWFPISKWTENLTCQLKHNNRNWMKNLITLSFCDLISVSMLSL